MIEADGIGRKMRHVDTLADISEKRNHKVESCLLTWQASEFWQDIRIYSVWCTLILNSRRFIHALCFFLC